MAAKGRVDTPRPQPPRVGLLASANNVVTDSDLEGSTRWIDGFAWVPTVCDGGGIIDPCGDARIAVPTNEDLIEVTPFVVEGIDNCTVFSQGNAAIRAEHQQMARDQLRACEQKWIEHELWAGTLTEVAQAEDVENKYLTNGDADLVEPGPLGYVTALAALERAIADGLCGDRGMIHARPDTVTFWVRENLVERVGNLLLTKLDTIVVPGRGYTGSLTGGPSLSTDSAWAFATSIVQVRRGQIFDTEPLIQMSSGAVSNNLTSRASRFAAVTWGCLHAGVRVLHTEATTVSGS